MKNNIYSVSSKEMVEIKKKLESDKKLFLAEINGENAQKLQDYLDIISKLFQFPIPARGLDGYNDWMRDLEWLDKDGYVLVIHNFEDFLCQDVLKKSLVINGFSNTILPFWEEEVKHVVADGQPKPFIIYLVDSL